ncbi:MAG TPA: hypothetical protein VLB44_27810 [Kofleriaceae bacterium]|nr:hypothetical protein [Kofleriaceae bacterium]
MAHKSKKKHLKHVHDHEPATPKAKSPVAMAEAATARVAKPAMKGSRQAMKAVGRARAATGATRTVRGAAGATPGKPRTAAGTTETTSGRTPPERGIVRSLARKATNRITAKPRKILSRMKARVKSFIGTNDE